MVRVTNYSLFWERDFDSIRLTLLFVAELHTALHCSKTPKLKSVLLAVPAVSASGLLGNATRALHNVSF